MGVLIIIFCIIFEVSSSVQLNLTASTGLTVTLSCRAPNQKLLELVEWSRPDIEERYVLLFLDDHPDPANQLPSFKNRVALLDRQMKDGDVSLVLKNVTINDTGTYECRVKAGTNRQRRAHLKTDPICIIYLSVVALPGNAGGSAGPTAGLSVIVCVLLLFF